MSAGRRERRPSARRTSPGRRTCAPARVTAAREATDGSARPRETQERVRGHAIGSGHSGFLVTGTQTQRAAPRPLLGPTASLSRLLHGQTTGSSRRWSAASLTAGALHAGGGVTWAQRAPRGVVAVGELSYGVAGHRCRYPGRDGTDLLDRHLGSSGRRHGLSGQPGWWSVTRRSSHLPGTPMCLRAGCGHGAVAGQLHQARGRRGRREGRRRACALRRRTARRTAGLHDDCGLQPAVATVGHNSGHSTWPRRSPNSRS
jgi:hypothetical protein